MGKVEREFKYRISASAEKDFYSFTLWANDAKPVSEQEVLEVLEQACDQIREHIDE